MEEYRLLKIEECVVDHPFWNRYTELIRNRVIPYQWEILNDRLPDSEPSHAIDNFRIAAGQMEGRFYGEVFQDSDVAKWLEAVGNILRLRRDSGLEEKADEVIEIIAAAQEEDGYLNTYFTIEAPEEKWGNLLECHELYSAGHFIEGAIAYYQATGKEKVLQIAIRLADCIERTFGREEGKIHGYPGHQEIEIAMLKLFDLCGSRKYLNLAQYFIDARGTDQFFEEQFKKRGNVCFWSKTKETKPNQKFNQFPYPYYNQFHLPVRQQKEAVGHAVRGVYMYTAMADLAVRTGDEELFSACKAIWSDIVNRQMYLTGGIGATHSGEAFTTAYDLPNDTNYAETCASIGLLFFAQRMLKKEVHRTYGDTMERALYNTILGGMNYEGDRFFYVNPLAVVPETCLANTERNHVKPVRQKWFSCACCPPNIARTIPNLWEYIYTAAEDTVYTHLFIGSEANIELSGGSLMIKQTTGYPWKNKVEFEVSSKAEQEFTLAIRIPEWSHTYEVRIDGAIAKIQAEENGYLFIRQQFNPGVRIELTLDLRPVLMEANQNVHYNGGRVAIMRGPLVYCMEEKDNGRYLNQLSLDVTQPLQEKESELWGGCILVKAKGYRHQNSSKDLYHVYDGQEKPAYITAVPYFLWNNRGSGEMQVWIQRCR